MAKDVKMTYLDVDGLGQKASDFYEGLAKEFINDYISSLAKILDSLLDGECDEDKTQQIVYDLFDQLRNDLKKNEEKLAEIVSDTILESYNIGFAEGSHMAEQQYNSTVLALIKDNKMNNPADFYRLTKIVKKVSDKRFEEQVKGKVLHISGNIFAEEDEDGK